MRVAVVGTGNIGTDLLEKLRRSDSLELAMYAGVDPGSPGLARARTYGVPISTDGVKAVLELDEPVELVYEATSARTYAEHAPMYREAGLRAVDLTPAKLGPAVVPAVNIAVALDASDVNMTSCGGQATVPMVAAVAECGQVEYAEIVSAIASASAGPGTRQNIDEFTRTTASALETVGRAQRGKAIIILNPADPPVLMRNAVICKVAAGADADEIRASVAAMAARVQQYVPGYRVTAGPEIEPARDGGWKVSVFLQVRGAGDFLPPYAGNLDIMTAAAVAVGEAVATRKAPVG